MCGTIDHYTRIFHERKMRMLHVNRKKAPKRKHFATADSHYGPSANQPEEDMDSELYKKKRQEFLEVLRCADKKKICMETASQSNSNLWYQERKKRITASNFGRVCKLRKTTSTAKLVSQLLYTTFAGNSSTTFGLENEETAIKLFQNAHNVSVTQSGLVIDDELPYLACSPDGLVGNNCIIEIKCSPKSGPLSPLEGAKQKKIDFCVIENGKLTLKRSHNYYYQIQGALHICKKQLCYFIIYTLGGLHVETIERDDDFWETKMKEKLADFYFNSLLPEIIDPRRCRQLQLRDIYSKI
uniref:YqaJ viral recombinase domain-containing protein n=1 Tax=Photinus pyralis TaxID=7054 RepID=A0A1Y1LUC9_PHOPY